MKQLRRWLFKWRVYLRTYFRDIDFQADDWRKDVDWLWRFRHTFLASPKVVKLMEQSIFARNNRPQWWLSPLQRDFAENRLVFPETNKFQEELEQYTHRPLRTTRVRMSHCASDHRLDDVDEALRQDVEDSMRRAMESEQERIMREMFTKGTPPVS